MKKPLVVIVLGKSGSGKGTQAELLLEKFGLTHISSGDLLRARAKINDFTGNKTASVVNSGGLMPISVVFGLWIDKFEEFKIKKGNLNGFVLDGMPRKLMEAMLLDDALGWYGWDKNIKVILIDISNREAISRLINRRICKKCKKIIPFVGEFKKMIKCPECQGELVKRTDDTVASVKSRLAWFKTDVAPVINYFRKTGRLLKINGEQSIENVFKDIVKALKS